MKTILSLLTLCLVNYQLRAQVSFTNSSSFSVGNAPSCVIAADVNGDGKPDLITANYGNALGNTLSVLTNNGSGGFALASSPVVGTGPRWVTAADVNGDGKLDLIASNYGNNGNQNTLSVLTNSGNGIFALASSPVLTSASFAVLALDINGDGKMDLISANADNTVEVLTNNGNGGFVIASSSNLGGNPRSIVAFTNVDGKVDLISANQYNNTLSFMTNNGNGGFGLAALLSGGNQPFEVTVADVNGDGKIDVISANYGNNTLSVWTNNGSGGFGLASSPAVGNQPFMVAAADVNADGKVDLISANYAANSLSVLTNNGNGIFGLAATLAATNNPEAVIAVDVNGDGQLDLISANGGNNKVMVWLNAAATQCDPPPAGLVSWWSAEGNAKDSMGTNNGTLIGSANFTNGEVGQAFSFDGSSGYVSIPDSPLMDSFTTNMTIELWLKSGQLTANSDWAGLVTKGNLSWRLQGLTGANTIDWAMNGVTPLELRGSRNVNDGLWHHVAAVYDGIKMYLYIDGTLDVSQPASGSISQTSDPVCIGKTYGAFKSSLFNGLIDEVSIYNRALSPSEIHAIFNASTNGKCPAPPATPSIVSQPTNQTVVIGQPVTFSMSAAGTAPLSYQWIFNGTNIVGATNMALTLNNVQLTNSGNYAVYISNPYGYTNSASALLTVAPASVPSPSGLVAWWRAEGNANDSIGNNNGSPVGNLGYTNGEVGQAFVFDGSTSYISLPPSPNLNLGTNGGLTIECWIYPNYPTNGAIPIIEWDSSTTAGLHFWAEASHRLFANIIDTSGNIHEVFSPINLLNTNSWQHVALTYDKTSGNAAFYYNGSISTNVNLGSFTPQTTYPMNIGRRTGEPIGLNDTFNGLMDELSLFNRALSSNEVAVIYTAANAGKTPPPPNIVTEPVSQTNLVGTLASFSVVAGGTQPLTYQWSFNGLSIFNATNATLTLSNLQPINAGNYSVYISNPYGSTNSLNATLTVTSPIPPAPVPVIIGINPVSAVAGTAITVTGTNFNSTTVSNVVYFGAVQAIVMSASTTNLTVNVPIGATYAPITVTVNGLTAYANQPFMPTFAGSGSGISTSSFASRQDLSAGNNPYHVIIADIDGDGKPDLVVANVFGNTISVYRNISTTGSLTSASFAPRVDFATTTGTYAPCGLAVADVDGDGKLDIVTTDESKNFVSIFRNTSTPGSITTNSFAARVDFVTGSQPQGVEVRDIDGDGRPELLVANSGDGTLSIFRNIGSVGSLTTNSFAARVNISTGSGCVSIVTGDLDGDGKPDVAVANSGSSTVSLLRNISVPGTIAFSPKADFAVPNAPVQLAIGDLDGDGKLDLTVAGYLSQTISVLRNTSTVGSLTTNSFAPRNDFSLGGRGHTPALADLEGDGKPDIAVVTELNSLLSIFSNVSTPGNFTNTSLAARMDFGAGWNAWGVSIGDLDGDGRPDVVFCNQYDGTISIYQNQVPFNSPPVIITQPTNQTVLAGGTATFKVITGGSSPQTYQWSYNSTNLVGATNATLILSNVQLSQAGNYSVQIGNTLGVTNSAIAGLTVVLPPVITTQPLSQSVLSFQSAAFTVAATGTGPITYQWRKNGTNLVDGGNIGGSLTTNLNLAVVTLADAGNYDVVVSSPYAATNSAVAGLTVPQTSLTIGSASAMSGSTLTVPIMMNALGVENTFLASVGYDTTKLVLQRVQLGQATAGAYLQEVDTQTNNGLVGFAILLNNGLVVPAGTQQVAQIVFNTLPVTNNLATSLTFGDTPTSRQVLDNNFDVLPATYLGGTISLTPAEYEADVYPRTNGDHQVSVQDWLEVGRMVAGLDVVTNSDEMLRADCAPRNAPDGILTVADWVQAGRYALGLDPLTLVPPPLVSQQKVTFHGSPAPTRTVELATVSAQRGQTVSVPVLLISSTNENAVGLTVTYNSSQLKYLSTALGSALSSGRLNINTNPAAGKVGLALALSPGASLAAGTNQIAVLQFQTATNAVGNLPLILDSSVVQLQVADKTAVALTANYVNGAVSLPPAPTVQTLKVGNNLTLAWPISAGSYVVQSANSPTGPWSNAPQNINTNGINANVTVQATNQQQFYRLLGQ